MRRSIAVLLLASMGLIACTSAESASDIVVDHDVIRVIDGLENVEYGVFALGSVWTVTSNRPDRFSAEPVEATLVRIDPKTLESESILDSPGVEPTVSELGDELWVKLADRIVALDADGSELSSIPFEPSQLGDLVAGKTHLWLTHFEDASVSVIDPSTATVVHTIDTGDFPVSPLSAFGTIWIPSSLDGTVTMIDEATLGSTTVLMPFVSAQQLEDVTAVPDAMTGDEVWVTTRDGDVFALTATADALGQVRQVNIDRAINRVHVHRDQAFLLPIAGRDVFVLDLQTEDLIARIPTDSIPFRAAVADDLVWVTGDGMAETLTVIVPETRHVRAQFQIGSNQSNTNGPHKPFAVEDQIWIPNRGDNTIFIIDTNQV